MSLAETKTCCFSLFFSLCFLFFFLIFFLAWLSVTSATHAAAVWTGTLYNLANTTVVLHGTAQGSSWIFMSTKIWHLLMAFHLSRTRGCELALLGGNMAFPVLISHRDSLILTYFPAHMLGTTGNQNSWMLLLLWFSGRFSCVLGFLLPFPYLVPPLHTQAVECQCQGSLVHAWDPES